MVAATVPKSDKEFRLAVQEVFDARNRLLRRSGFSPWQLALGREPPLPGDLLEEPASIVANELALDDKLFARTMAIRMAARQATVASADGRRHHVIEVLASWALGLPGPTRLDDTPAPGSNPTCSIKSVH